MIPMPHQPPITALTFNGPGLCALSAPHIRMQSADVRAIDTANSILATASTVSRTAISKVKSRTLQRRVSLGRSTALSQEELAGVEWTR